MDYLDATHLDSETSQKTQKLIDSFSQVSLATYSRPPFILTKGSKCTVWDSLGREFLDFSGGIAVNALGHSDEGVKQVMVDQAGKLVHNSNLYHNEWAGQLALSLATKTKQLGGLGFEAQPEGLQSQVAPNGLKVFFTNSGTESNEGALKFVRKWGKLVHSAAEGGKNQQPTMDANSEKVEIVSFRDGFHGRSLGALSATWQDKYQAPFAPLLPGLKPATLNDIDALKTVITEKTCGVIVEPIQGEGGILEASEEFLRALRKRCDEVGALLVFDEIQCGLGRTGHMWAHSSMPTDCHPDIVTMAKPLANGFPIGAIIMKDKVADVIKIGDHGTTFGGGPLQTRIGHHVLERISKPEFLQSVQQRSKHLLERLSNLPELFPRIVAGSPRGRGLIVGLPLKSDTYVQQVTKHCRERGLLLLSCGKSTVRFVPSLIVTDQEVEKCCDILESVLVIMNRQSEGL